MRSTVTVAMLASALAVSACADRNSQYGGQMVTDPYAQGGYPGGVDPATLAAQATPEYFRASVGDTVLFPVDQSTLTPEARSTLAAQAQWLTTNQSFATVIEGHADEQGTREYNLALGARRANSVQEYLISQGIQAGRIRTVSYGKERPLAICSEESCYNRNRRAVTVVRPGAGS